MSVVPNFQVNGSALEDGRQPVHRSQEEVARLSEMELGPADYFAEFLKRVMPVLAASAAAIWVRTSQGAIQLQYQVNLGQIGLDEDPDRRKIHDELLRNALQQGRTYHLPAQSSPGPEVTRSGNRSTTEGPGNPTNFELLLTPIVVDRQASALVEVWFQNHLSAEVVPVAVQFLGRMAALASIYLRNYQRRDMVAQQQLWTDLEAFARHAHGSLHPQEVANVVANEGRRLVACDRISIALRQGRRPAVVAISGADVVEKRSQLVRLMRLLFTQVLAWGEPLVYKGTRDESLPPGVVKALDAYLAESESKLLVMLPLRDDRETEKKLRPRSALLMECFEPGEAPEKLQARLEIVGRHAAGALYNAVEYRRIPLRWVWRPLATLQEGLGGKGRALVFLTVMLVVAAAGGLAYFPYPLKMDAQGQLLPEQRCWIYSPVEGKVVRFAEGVEPGKTVAENQSLVLLYDVQLELKLAQLNGQIGGAEQEIAALARQEAGATTEDDRLKYASQKKQKEFLRDRTSMELAALRERTHSDEARPGNFWLKAPMNGTVLNWEFQESLTNRHVRPADPLLRVGNKDKAWLVELKIPQKHIGQVLQAFDPADPEAELDVDLLLSSAPTRTFKGKLTRSKIGGEAKIEHDDPAQTEPVVLASVRLDGAGIDEADRIPPDLLVTGTEVHTKVRCGDRPMGYSFFYGIWEFIYEKVVFPFSNG